MSPQSSSDSSSICMNFHLGATKKSLPIALANQQADRANASSDRDSNKELMAPNVLIVFPKFNSHSFWNLQEVCDIAGVRFPAPPLGLITVAAALSRAAAWPDHRGG